jgi:hypothetical protein
MTPLTKKAQEVLTKLVKTSGVVDRTIGEINELQWGYRHMRAPYAEANASSRNVNYMNDYFAKQSALIPGGDKGKAAKAGKTPKDFPKKLIQQGMKVESEHTSSKPIQKEITTDHLTEDKEYYIKLKKMEKAGALLRDVDSRNKIIQNAKDRGALAGSAVGASVALLLARKRKYKPLAGALGVVPGFFAGSALTGAAVSAYQGAQDLAKQALFLDKFPKIRKGLATAMTAGALAAPARSGGLGDLAKAMEVDIPKLEHRSSQVFYHKPESPTAQKYVLDAGLKGKHWVASDTSRTTLPSGAEKRHVETMLLNQEGGTDSRMVVKEIVNPKTPGLVNRESWVKPIKYEEVKSYLDMKKTLAAK